MKSTPLYPCVEVDAAPVAAVAQVGGITLTQTVAVTGLGTVLSHELGRWRKPLAVHDPAKVLLDLAVTLALGAEHLSDIAVLRSETALYGRVAGAYVMVPEIRGLIGYPGQMRNPPRVDEAYEALEDGILDKVIERGPIYVCLEEDAT